jgi:hypothetical protein
MVKYVLGGRMEEEDESLCNFWKGGRDAYSFL